jgi:hypothetical protein
MPLNLSDPVDVEVFHILRGFSSAMECKNFLLSAVLYYARSPLVLSANALVDAVNKVRIQDILAILDEILSTVKDIQACPAVFQNTPVSFVAGTEDFTLADKKSSLSVETKSALASLRRQFKV